MTTVPPFTWASRDGFPLVVLANIAAVCPAHGNLKNRHSFTSSLPVTRADFCLSALVRKVCVGALRSGSVDRQPSAHPQFLAKD